jgi:hypothetical protein
MLAMVQSCAVVGLDGARMQVEVDLAINLAGPLLECEMDTTALTVVVISDNIKTMVGGVIQPLKR